MNNPEDTEMSKIDFTRYPSQALEAYRQYLWAQGKGDKKAEAHWWHVYQNCLWQ